MSRRKTKAVNSSERRASAQKKRVRKLPPEAEAARDEGPRLIPLPDVDSPYVPPVRASGELQHNRYVALADTALRLWSKTAEANGKTTKKTPPRPKRKR